MPMLKGEATRVPQIRAVFNESLTGILSGVVVERAEHIAVAIITGITAVGTQLNTAFGNIASTVKANNAS